ncbi:response regulator transcription factor [Planctomicrobium sp. SH664]|uniref:response regulator transcription factor n=1 Tax=Planctomicrobium sp. SH664 TaxID=3448125 RepID=UPI003F5AE7E6
MSGRLTSVDVIINRILVVESSREEADFLRSYLQQHRFDVEIARDAGQARAAFSMHQPDFVILEAILPNDVSGFEVCERMKRENDGVPVLMLTVIDMDDARSLARRVGADAYMTKPYDPDELLDQIRAVAENVWARKHLGDESAAGDKVRFHCVGCGKHLKAKASHRGRTLNCPRCGKNVVVPAHD